MVKITFKYVWEVYFKFNVKSNFHMESETDWNPSLSRNTESMMPQSNIIKYPL